MFRGMYIAIVDVEDVCLTIHNLLHCSSVPVKRRGSEEEREEDSGGEEGGGRKKGGWRKGRRRGK